MFLSPRQIIQFYYMGWLTCSFFSVHWTLNAIKAYKHRICLTIVRLCDSHRIDLWAAAFTRTRTLCPSHSCILVYFQQQYAKAHRKKKNEREKIKKNKNSYEIVANEIILTFKCVYTTDKLAAFFSSPNSHCSASSKCKPLQCWEKHSSSMCARVWGRRRERKKGSESVGSGIKQKWGVRNRELSNDPRDTHTGYVFMLLFILRFYAGYIMMSSHSHTRARTEKMKEIHIRSPSRIAREREKLIKLVLKIFHWLAMVSLDLGRTYLTILCVCCTFQGSLQNEPSE